MAMTQLHFPKLSRFDRIQEPVTVSIPCAEGRLPHPDHLGLVHGSTRLPRQVRPLGQWPDGSVRWALVHFQPDLPGNQAQDLTLVFDVGASPPDPVTRVALTLTKQGVYLDTGPLHLEIHTDATLSLRNLRLQGTSFGAAPELGGIALQTQTGRFQAVVDTVEIVEAGPLRAVVALIGRHRNDHGAEALMFRGLLTAYAGKPYVELEHQFIHDGEEAEIGLVALTAHFRLQHDEDPATTPALALGEGYYRTRIQTASSAIAMDIDAETLLYQANEHFTESFYGDFWVDWRQGTRGLAVTHYQAHQHYPKALRADTTGIVADLYPSSAQPARILQGMGKTHRLLLHFHDGQADLEDLSTRSLQFQIPDVPVLPRTWYRDNNPWQLNFFPSHVPGRLISRFNALHAARPQALGMMHFGDAPDAGYTDQGRGSGATVWVNNEYDRPHMSLLYYALTGQRRMLDSALVCARHWLDVDFCHYHPNPLIQGGLKIHTAYHGTGGVVPSHEWTEGFLDYYYLTGRQEALDAATAIGHNILRHMALSHMRTPGEAAVREGGWALRALIGLYLATGTAYWHQEATRLAQMFLDWYDTYGALLAPYTSHTMPRVPFMIAITVNSLARYRLLDDDARIGKLIVDVVEDLLAHTLGPDGITFYKELPSLERTAPTPHFLEALTHAYLVSGHADYLRIAARQFAALVAQPVERQGTGKFVDTDGAVIDGKGGGRQFADTYSSLLLFAAAATPLGILDWYEYPYAYIHIEPGKPRSTNA